MGLQFKPESNGAAVKEANSRKVFIYFSIHKSILEVTVELKNGHLELGGFFCLGRLKKSLTVIFQSSKTNILLQKVALLPQIH